MIDIDVLLQRIIEEDKGENSPTGYLNHWGKDLYEKLGEEHITFCVTNNKSIVKTILILPHPNGLEICIDKDWLSSKLTEEEFACFVACKFRGKVTNNLQE